MNICMYVLYAYIRVCMHLCVYACMYICMHGCIHVCMYVIFKLGFEQYERGNCPSWEGECPFPKGLYAVSNKPNCIKMELQLLANSQTTAKSPHKSIQRLKNCKLKKPLSYLGLYL